MRIANATTKAAAAGRIANTRKAAAAQQILEAKREIVLSLAKDKDVQAFARACKSYTNTYERFVRNGIIKNK